MITEMRLRKVTEVVDSLEMLYADLLEPFGIEIYVPVEEDPRVNPTLREVAVVCGLRLIGGKKLVSKQTFAIDMLQSCINSNAFLRGRVEQTLRQFLTAIYDAR